jgi:hypothetical protein
VPPAAGHHDTLRHDSAVALEVLADHVHVVEATLPDRQHGGIAARDIK